MADAVLLLPIHSNRHTNSQHCEHTTEQKILPAEHDRHQNVSRQQTDALLLLPAPSALTRQHSKQT
jgi:hypothetical protein